METIQDIIKTVEELKELLNQHITDALSVQKELNDFIEKKGSYKRLAMNLSISVAHYEEEMESGFSLRAAISVFSMSINEIINEFEEIKEDSSNIIEQHNLLKISLKELYDYIQNNLDDNSDNIMNTLSKINHFEDIILLVHISDENSFYDKLLIYLQMSLGRFRQLYTRLAEEKRKYAANVLEIGVVIERLNDILHSVLKAKRTAWITHTRIDKRVQILSQQIHIYQQQLLIIGTVEVDKEE